jgi:hypothetical protein
LPNAEVFIPIRISDSPARFAICAIWTGPGVALGKGCGEIGVGFEKLPEGVSAGTADFGAGGVEGKIAPAVTAPAAADDITAAGTGEG